MTRQHLLLIALLSVSACKHEVVEVRDYQATFLCEGDQRMHVVFAPYKAVLDSQGVSVAMEQKPAADGYHYAGGGQDLRAVGGEATWKDGKGAVHHCREAPR